MTRSIVAEVEPDVLAWARLTAGFDSVGAARKIGLPDDRVAQWEAGEAKPTVAQLRKAATVYNRTLAVFFLPTAPRDFDTMRDFRRVESGEASEWSPGLHAEFRRAQMQRGHALELAELDESPPSDRWRIAASTDLELAAEARRTLLALTPLQPPDSNDPYGHLNAWTAALEEVGVLVLNTSGGSVEVREMRAFSLYHETLPVIMVNGSDAVRGRLFSLLHEYAHLLLHTGGLCDAVTDRRAVSPDRRLEARCNALAAEVLMPAFDVLALPKVAAATVKAWEYDELRDLAGPFGVSAEAFLRRLVTLGKATEVYYAQQRRQFLRRYEEEDSAKGGGGNWYRNKARDLGKGYVRSVASAWQRRVIDSTTASTLLDAKVDQIPQLAEAAALADQR